MKSRITISILLAVLMLGTLATPALAGAPVKGSFGLTDPTNHPGEGKLSLQITRDNYLKVTAVVKGAKPGNQYDVYVYVSGYGPSENLGTLEISKNGRGRFSGFTNRNDYAGIQSVTVDLRHSGLNKFQAFIWVNFN
jgi:hypothetical protein